MSVEYGNSRPARVAAGKRPVPYGMMPRRSGRIRSSHGRPMQAADLFDAAGQAVAQMARRSLRYRSRMQSMAPLGDMADVADGDSPCRTGLCLYSVPGIRPDSLMACKKRTTTDSRDRPFCPGADDYACDEVFRSIDEGSCCSAKRFTTGSPTVTSSG